MAKCCISKVPLRGAVQEKWPWGTELYARLFYVSTEETEVLMVAMDTLTTLRRMTIYFREKVSAGTGIPADNIWYHETQAHAAPYPQELLEDVMDKITARVVEEVNQMRERAKTFTCEVAEAYAGTKYTMNREQYVAGLGGVTVWAGLKFDETGRPYTKDPGRMLLRGYEPNLPVFDEPVYFDNNNDPLAYLFVFKDEEGNVIGTLSRFAAHPDLAVLFESHPNHDPNQYHYNFDWPGYLSTRMEEHFGAPSMYINGPCGNLATKKAWDGYDTYEKSDEECQRIGNAIADMLLERYEKKTVDFGDANNCKAARFVMELPIKEDFPRSMEEMLKYKEEAAGPAEAAFREAIAAGEPAYRVKQLGDDWYRAQYIPQHLVMGGGFNDEDLKRGTAFVDVTALRLGDYLFMGVPGESMAEMSDWLRSTFTGKKTIPVDQVNGHYSYMANPAQLYLGGYTYWYSWTSRESIPKLKEDIVAAMEGFLD